jgi:hypothetical protein
VAARAGEDAEVNPLANAPSAARARRTPSPPGTPSAPSARARRTRRARQAALAALAALVAYGLVAYVVDGFTPSPGGVPSSSYATSAEGLAAYAQLLQRTGHPVSQLRSAPSAARLGPDTTLVVLDPQVLTAGGLNALRSFLQAGGTLIAGGSAVNPSRWLGALTPNPPTWSPTGPTTSYPLTSTPYTAGAGRVRSAGFGSFTAPGSALPAVGAGGNALLDIASVGAGKLLMLADASPLQDFYLARGDNAALAVALAGPPGRRVSFAESVHGYGVATGLAALPKRWKWALIGLLLAAAVAIAARFRRLGDPDPAPDTPQPPRRAHVEALALALKRTGQPAAAAAPVHDRAREIVIARAGLTDQATPQEVLAGAEQLGLGEPEARSVAALDVPRDDDGVIVVGRALAKLESR